MLLIHTTLICAALYLYWRVLQPLRWRWWWKAAAAALLAPVVLRYTILRQIGGSSRMGPDVPPWLLYTGAALYIAFLIYLCGVVGLHLLQLVGQRYHTAWGRLPRERQQALCNKLHLLLLPLALGIATLCVCEGVATPRVRHITLPFPTQEPLRIVLISDLHICATRRADFTQAVVQQANAQQPDVIFIVGDFVDGAPEICAEHLAPLRQLQAPLGVYGVSGNHDYYSGYTRWKPLLTRLGIRMLDNEHLLLRPQGPVLAGVCDESAQGSKLPTTDLQAALRGAPPGIPIILLAHRPIVARDAAPAGVRLQLSGHLHGGLVWGLGEIIALMDAGFRAGLYRVGEMQLYVSAGAGTSARTPMRLGVPAEINVITLSPEKN